MSKKNDWLRQLKQRAKKRQEQPHAQPVRLAATGRQQERMVDFHLPVLMAIELSLLDRYRERPDQFDDQAAAQAVAASIRGMVSETSLAAELQDAITEGRQGLEVPPSEELWREGLQVVYSSIKRHSQCRPGDRDYFRFLEQQMRLPSS